MKVTFISNSGDGTPQTIEVPDDTTLDIVLRQKGVNEGQVVISHNRQRVPAGSAAQTRLQDGDRVAVTPTNMKGAIGSEGAEIRLAA